MFDIRIFDNMDLEEKLKNMIIMLEGLIQDNNESDLSKLCNACALINAIIKKGLPCSALWECLNVIFIVFITMLYAISKIKYY